MGCIITPPSKSIEVIVVTGNFFGITNTKSDLRIFRKSSFHLLNSSICFLRAAFSALRRWFSVSRDWWIIKTNNKRR